MSKIYSLLMWMMAFVVCAPIAEAKTVTVIVDNPEAAGYRDPLNNYDTGYWDANNSVTFNFTEDITIPVMASEGFDLVSLTKTDGSVIANGPTSSFTIFTESLDDGETVTVNTAEKEPKVLKIIGDPSQVYVTDDTYNSHYADDNVDGAWTIACTSDWGSTYIYANEGYLLTSVADTNGVPYLYTSPNSSCSIYHGSLSSGTTEIIVMSKSEAELYDGYVTVNVDGPAYMVSFKFDGMYDGVQLEEGTNTVRFDHATALPFTIQHSYFSSYNPEMLYSVTLNGTKLEPVDGIITVNTVSNGDVFDIKVNPPAADVSVKVLFTDEISKNALNVIRLDGEPVDPATYGEFQAQTGQTLMFDFDYNNYDVTLTENGAPVYINYGSYSHKLINEEGYTYEISAAAKQPMSVTIICENWEHLIVSKDYSGDEAYTLTGVETTLSIMPADVYTFFKPETGWRITSITDVNTSEVMSSTSINVTDGMMLFVEVEEYVRDKHATVFIQPNTWNYVMVVLSPQNYDTRYEFSPEPGYTTFAFNDDDRPFGINGSDASYQQPSVYLNGVLCENVYGTYPELANVADGDIIKLMPIGAETSPVTYTITGEANVTVKHDITRKIDPALTHNEFDGTEIHIIPEDGTQIEVTANGTPVEADNEGKYVHIVNGATDFAVSAVSGIAGIASDGDTASDVYNLQGILVLRAATAEQIEALPAGVYIAAGKKIVVK